VRKERVSTIKTKERKELSLAELFELASGAPSELDGINFENKIRDVIFEFGDKIAHKQDLYMSRVNSMHMKICEIEHDLQEKEIQLRDLPRIQM
jgi:hypothetical protein